MAVFIQIYCFDSCLTLLNRLLALQSCEFLVLRDLLIKMTSLDFDGLLSVDSRGGAQFLLRTAALNSM